jgi:ribonuclease HI
MFIFDGASKKNTWVAGARGIIQDHEGNEVVNYIWGLGNVSNNLDEVYVAMCGLIMAKEERISNLIVFGDSLLVIQEIN